MESGREAILCGDWNIAHKKEDLKNWKGNLQSSGFLPEERAWMDQLIDDLGFVDAFRLVIKQTPAEINLLDGGVSLAFKLDGSEQSISALNRAGYPKGKAAWDGSKLVLSTRQDVYVGHAQFDTRATKDVYSLDGGMLTIEKTDSFQGKTRSTKLVYSKATS